MIHEFFPLPVSYPSEMNGGQKPSLKSYFLENFEAIDSERKRPLVLVCPGGGYNHLSPREGEAIAIKMNSLGFHSAVLTYSLAPMEFPAALCDLAEAVYFLRKNSKRFNIDPDKIIVCGFSAGGHLAASLGALWNSDFLKKFIPYQPEEIRPDSLILCYPVITADARFCHKGSIQNVSASQSKEHLELVSIENNISKDFPPAFIWHTNADQSVPVENSLLLVNALRKAGVDFEYHLFSRGKHGLALATKETSKPDGSAVEAECAVWPELFLNWYLG